MGTNTGTWVYVYPWAVVPSLPGGEGDAQRRESRPAASQAKQWDGSVPSLASVQAPTTQAQRSCCLLLCWNKSSTRPIDWVPKGCVLKQVALGGILWGWPSLPRGPSGP